MMGGEADRNPASYKRELLEKRWTKKGSFTGITIGTATKTRENKPDP